MLDPQNVAFFLSLREKHGELETDIKSPYRIITFARGGEVLQLYGKAIYNAIQQRPNFKPAHLISHQPRDSNDMGIIHPKDNSDRPIGPIVDRVFNYFSGHSGKDELTFQELYTAVLLVYNDINKHFPGPHYDPPTREEVQDMLKTFDTNKDDALDREEFAAFIHKFTSKVAKRVGRNILIFVVAAPALAFATKRATEGLPRVGKFVQRIPNAVYASFVTAVVLLVERANQKRLS
ncbi:hypothetical protein L7F22_017751 [Adiantum nelumboides]|nr:hypothetical protein [Adiantum nelumboides]